MHGAAINISSAVNCMRGFFTTNNKAEVKPARIYTVKAVICIEGISKKIAICCLCVFSNSGQWLLNCLPKG